jgi:hypothetical protein
MNNDEFAVGLAMLKAAPKKRKPKLNPVEYARRFTLEKILQRGRYCHIFALWKTCRLNPCRRHRACNGDQHACLRRALDRVPRDVQLCARQDIIAATPLNFGGPEREARKCMPRDLYE